MVVLKLLGKAYGGTKVVVLSKTKVYEWYKVFKDGREVIQDMPRCGGKFQFQ